MTSRTIVKAAELKRMADIANSEGVSVEIERDGVKIRVTPFHPENRGARNTLDDGQTALAKWQWENGRAISTTPRKGKGGFDIIDDPKHPLAKWYKDLGFNPETMNEADLQRLIKKAENHWKASIPEKKVGKREWAALEKLTQIGVGRRILQWKVSGCGDDTLARLVARGFVGEEELLSQAEVKKGLSKKEVWLLEPGHAAYNSSIAKA